MANINANTVLGQTTGWDFNQGIRGFAPGTQNSGTTSSLIMAADNVTFTATDSMIFIGNGDGTGFPTGEPQLSTLNVFRDGSSFDLTRVIVDMNTSDAFSRTACALNFNDVTFYQSGGIRSTGVNWGNWADINGGADNPVYTINGMNCYGESLFMNFSRLSPNSVFSNISFYNGNADDRLGAYLESGQQQAYPNATFGPITRLRGSAGGGTGRCIIRINNENNAGGGDATGWSPFSQLDLRAIPLIGDATGNNSNRLCINLDMDVAMWIINPLLPDFSADGPAGAVVDNSLQLCASTNGAQRMPTTTSPSRYRVCQGWNPRILDSNDSTPVADTKIRFDSPLTDVFVVPQTYTYANAPANITGAVRTLSDNPNDNGYLFQNQEVELTSVSANPVSAPNQTLNTTFAPRTGRLYSLTHGVGNEIGREWTLTYPGVNQPLTDDVDTLNTLNATEITWGTTTDYPLTLDTYYAFGSNETQVSNLDNIYPSLKTAFYNDEDDFTGIGVEGSGDNTLTFSRTTTFQTLAATRNVTSSTTVRLASTVDLGANITTLVANNAVMRLNDNVTWPSGMTLQTMGSAVMNISSDTTLSAGTTFNGSNINAASTHIADGQTFIGGTEIELSDGIDFRITNATVPSGIVTLSSGGGVPITITVPADLNAGPTGTRGFRAGSDVTIQNAPTTNVLNIPAPANGRYCLIATKGGVRSVNGPANIASGTPLSFTLSGGVSPDGAFFSNFADGDTIDLLVKYDSTPAGTNSVVYDFSTQRFNFNATVDGTPLNAIVETVATTLVSASVAYSPADFTMTDVGSTEGSIQLTNTASASQALSLTNGQTVTAAIIAGNLDNVFNAWCSRGINDNVFTRPVDFRQGNISAFDARIVTIRSGNRPGTPTFIQHQVIGWVNAAATGTLFPTTDGVVEIINQTPGLAIVPVDTIVGGIDQSDTADRVRRIQNGVGYMVGTGGDSRLLGIKPRSANYVPGSTTDEGNL